MKNIQHFPKNYSENDLKNLVNQRRRKNEYINRILDTDIHINMNSESNTPLNEKIKYMRNSYRFNNYIHLNNINQKYNNSIQKSHYQNKKLKNEYNNNNYQNIEYNYNFNFDELNNNLNNSINLNKPFHRERRHFPLVNNKGNFFKNITPFLVENTERIERANLIKRQNDINNFRYNKYMQNGNNLKRYQDEKLRRNNSMMNIPVINSNINDNKIKNNNHNNQEYIGQMANSVGDEILSKRYKFYNPYRYDYEGSRYGDNTCDCYLNSPMRSDISADWKFPPLYYYNYNPNPRK